jgi:hypothetical protein
MPNRRQLTRIWWLSGLVLVLAFLAHDVIMASVAHAAPVVPATTAALEQGSPHVAAHGENHLADRHPAPEHPRGCGTTATAVARSGGQPDASDLGAPAILTADELAALASAGDHWWTEPHWPPGKRRALFQVYRV